MSLSRWGEYEKLSISSNFLVKGSINKHPLENKSVKYGRIVYSSTQLIYPNIITYDSTLQKFVP